MRVCVCERERERENLKHSERASDTHTHTYKRMARMHAIANHSELFWTIQKQNEYALHIRKQSEITCEERVHVSLQPLSMPGGRNVSESCPAFVQNSADQNTIEVTVLTSPVI